MSPLQLSFDGEGDEYFSSRSKAEPLMQSPLNTFLSAGIYGSLRVAARVTTKKGGTRR